MGDVWARLGSKWERYAPDKNFSDDSAITFASSLETLFKVTVYSLPFTQRFYLCKVGPKELIREYLCSEKMSFCVVKNDLHPHTSNQGQCILYGHKHSLNEVWAKLNQREIRHAPEKEFSYHSFITLTLHLKPWFKLTTNPYPKATCG